MKKLSLVFSILILLTTESCKKNKVEQKADEISISEMKLQTLSQQKSPESIKQVYNLLSKSEKCEYWKRHLQLVLSDENTTNDLEKKKLIKELLSLLKPAIFDPKSPEHGVFLAYEFQIWRQKASEFFTEQQLYEILNENRQNISTARVVTNSNTNIYDEFIPPNEGSVGCFCNAGSSGFSCKLISIGSGDLIKYGMCEAPSSHPCASSSSGCGWFWLQACNGAHCNFG
jgi:hypothetical protein